MNMQAEEVIDKIVDILKQEGEELQKEYPNLQPGVIQTEFNHSDFDELERKFEVRIPKIQKDFIKKYSPVRFHLMYTDIYGLSGLNKELEDYVPEELLQEGLLPFAGCNGDYYCLNMGKDEDKVYFFDHEEFGASDSNMTFANFFKSLLEAKIEIMKKDNM